LTGSNADLWLNAKPGSEIHVALAVLKKLLQRGSAEKVQPELRTKLFGLVEDVSIDSAAAKSGLSKEKILLLAETLVDAKRSVVISGGASSATNSGMALAVVTHYINALLGNVGKTIHPTVVQKPQTSIEKVKALVESLEAEKPLDIVFVHGTNPVFSLPSASRFKYALKRAGLIVSMSSHLDETAQLADLILPTHTGLESWGDTAGRPGVYGLRQPVMKPVFDTREFGDLLIELAGADAVAGGEKDFQGFLKAQWKEIFTAASSKPETFDTFWLESLERGGYFADYNLKKAGTAEVKLASLDKTFSTVRFSTQGAAKKGPVLMPYPSVKSFDGRAANRPWLQELPDPVTKAVWGSWVEMHPKTAKKYGIKDGKQVQLTTHYGEVSAPVYITEYISEDVVAVPIGEGHTSYGRFAPEGGGNFLQLLPDQLKEATHGVQQLSTRVAVKRGRGTDKLVLTQGSSDQMDRHLSQTKVIDPAEEHGHHDDHHGGHHEEVEHFYDQRPHPLYNWGMAVDLAACTGCSACVVACYAENNIPTVGKEVCDQGREMSWLRIERYYDGSAEELQVNFLPMMCQHCNNAPCEPVCPVYATYHNEEGLNAMVYNRCVGTRYCGNNCSYKVRRYNWFEFDWPTPLDWQLNPDVTKRTAGVMEKCTFCVQRINEGKDRAKDEGRLVRDGEIKPACVQSCPTEALVFGNLNDPKSKVSKLAKDTRAYKVLDHHLNTQPSISYLQNIKHKV
jgi:molybdopterin-containing oxidoreductase family iron-sulfur binding subunit